MDAIHGRHPGESGDVGTRSIAPIPHHSRFRWRGVIGWLLALILLVLPATATAQTFPKFTGLVTDAAGILPAERKAALEAKLEAFQQQTHRQLVVATVPDLQGYEISDYGYRLGRAWAVGLKGVDNGTILLVAPNERKVRIEVGYGMEPVLTDALSSVIIRDTIIPAFKAGDFPGGIDAGSDALIHQLSLPDDLAKGEVAKAAAEFDKQHKKSSTGGGLPLGLIFWGVVVGFIVLSNLGRRAGRRYRGAGGSNWPIWLWAASEIADSATRNRGGGWGGGGGWSGGGGGGSDGSWGGGGFTGGGGGSFGGGGASGSW